MPELGRPSICACVAAGAGLGAFLGAEGLDGDQARGESISMCHGSERNRRRRRFSERAGFRPTRLRLSPLPPSVAVRHALGPHSFCIIPSQGGGHEQRQQWRQGSKWRRQGSKQRRQGRWGWKERRQCPQASQRSEHNGQCVRRRPRQQSSQEVTQPGTRQHLRGIGGARPRAYPACPSASSCWACTWAFCSRYSEMCA
jgi:hypothetical protein